MPEAGYSFRNELRQNGNLVLPSSQDGHYFLSSIALTKTDRWRGGEPQLAAAPLLHLAPAPRRLVPEPAAVLPEPSPLHAQPPCRAPGQKPTRADDRPRPSALADPVGIGTASASASLNRGGWPPPPQNTFPTEIRPPQAGGFRTPCVTQKGQFLNHAQVERLSSSETKIAPRLVCG